MQALLLPGLPHMRDATEKVLSRLVLGTFMEVREASAIQHVMTLTFGMVLQPRVMGSSVVNDVEALQYFYCGTVIYNFYMKTHCNLKLGTWHSDNVNSKLLRIVEDGSELTLTCKKLGF
ncbi:hypothetical protein GRJ2_002306600 [Grus japonensis]|uniref:Uncharacterized protein n=1 Tax=Grus japonensis TaxID=30415 RepID=A0ABC9XMZ4_GRUJA